MTEERGKREAGR
jgi:hypothetical protein